MVRNWLIVGKRNRYGESILNAALEGEMDAHLTEEERQMGNRRNGKMQKQVQTCLLYTSGYRSL